MSHLPTTHLPALQAHTITVTIVATTTPAIAAAGAANPNIPNEVSVAKMPPAGVNAPYIQDWKPAAREPSKTDLLVKYRPRNRD
jgi:hypothetical protein